MTLKNNRAPFLCYFKLCASFHSHWWIQTGNAQSGSNSTIFSAVWPWNLADDLEQGKSEGFDSCDLPSNLAQILSKSLIFQPVCAWNLMHDLKQGKSEGFESCDRPIIRKRPIWVKIGDVLYHVTLKFDGWPWETIGHLSFAVSSFVQHFIAIDEFKLELQSGNAQLGSNSTIFRAVWPWNLTYDLETQWAPLLCYFKLYASFRSHRWIWAGVTVRKRPIWVKIDDFFSRVTLKFDVWPWKTIRHLFCATSSFVQHFIAIGDFKLELQSGNSQFGSNSTIFRAVWPWNLRYDLEKQYGTSSILLQACCIIA